MITKNNVLEDDLNRLLDVWEQSVKATHTTINESMIESMRPTILTGLASMDAVYVFESNRFMQGFIGVLNGAIEMLYVSPEFRNKDIAGSLVREVLQLNQAITVDIPETNLHEKLFYQNLGFKLDRVNPIDQAGNRNPMLHMKYQSQ